MCLMNYIIGPMQKNYCKVQDQDNFTAQNILIIFKAKAQMNKTWMSSKNEKN